MLTGFHHSSRAANLAGKQWSCEVWKTSEISVFVNSSLCKNGEWRYNLHHNSRRVMSQAFSYRNWRGARVNWSGRIGQGHHDSMWRRPLLGQATKELSVRMLPIFSRISDTANGFLMKCQFGSIATSSPLYPDIRTIFISGRSWFNCAAISKPFIFPGITTSETKRSIFPPCSLAVFKASVPSLASRKTASTDRLSTARISLRMLCSSSTMSIVLSIRTASVGESNPSIPEQPRGQFLKTNNSEMEPGETLATTKLQAKVKPVKCLVLSVAWL
jgi:hypothetical protein